MDSLSDEEADYRELAKLVPSNDVLLRWAAKCSKAPDGIDLRYPHDED